MKFLVLGIVVVSGITAWLWLDSSAGESIVIPKLKFPGANPAETQSAAAYTVPAFQGETYRNSRFGFSLALPEGFRAQELPRDERGGVAIVLQDARGDGIQIYVTPNVGDYTTLTAGDVRAAIPDMHVTDDMPVEIGEHNTGVAFMSDNDAFGGASREVWFYFGGNLFQISTYAHLDELLKAMFGTWQFSV